jgi:hypothetical protein
MCNFCLRWLFVVLLALATLGCDQRVPIPTPEQDAKPVIHVGAVASGGSGQIKFPDANAGSCASPCKNPVSAGTQLVLSISAQNPGGVKYLSAVIAETGKPSYSVQLESQPDKQNRVPTQLTIAGHNGAGGVGSTPIGAKMTNPTGTFTVLVSATNYNGMPSLYTVTYYIAGHVQASLAASPVNITQGDSATLTWSTTHATSVMIDPLGTQLLSGSKTISPNATTTYTLAAKDWLESTTKIATVTVGERPKEGCLAGGLNFIWDPGRYGGTGEITVGVRFRGTLKSAPVSGSTAALQYTQTETPTLSNYAGYKAVPFQACQLMAGTWAVSAEVISGPLPKRTIPCTAIVPGSVQFNYEDSTCLP